MKSTIIIALLLCSIGVRAQRTGVLVIAKNHGLEHTSFMLKGIEKIQLTDTTYNTSENYPTQTITKVYTLKDSTKYTERYTSKFNGKYWDFKSVELTKGSPNIIRFNKMGIGSMYFTPGPSLTYP